MKLHCRVLLVQMFFWPSLLFAQYWSERTMEKGFEQTDFFFTPSYILPYGMGGFKATTPGLMKDPLLDFIVNPARLGLDSAQNMYFYTDFRGAKNVKEEDNAYYLPWQGYAANVRSAVMDMSYYPRLYLDLNTRRELEPIFSGAFIARLLPVSAPGVVAGITYQMVLQDDKYYSIPQDIYRSIIGYDYSGERVAASSTLPIVDKYSGNDNIHQAGHHINAFLQAPLSDRLEAGLKIGRVMFKRNGALGSSNFWQYSVPTGDKSFWSNMETRDQSYTHWDLAGGVTWRVTEQTTIGATAGHLWGDATQALTVHDSSNYLYQSAQSNSLYLRSGLKTNLWDHSGKSTYFGFDFKANANPATTLGLLYRHQESSVALRLNAAVFDTSYSTYSWTDNTVTSMSTSQSYLSDVRGGLGDQTVASDRILGSVQWRINDQVDLSIGAQLDWQSTETKTTESVLAANRYAYSSSSGGQASDWRREESKDLIWNFSAKRTSFQIPIILSIRASAVWSVILGLNRNMTQWKIDDMTLALYRYRTNVNNGTIERVDNFGERYTTPTEDVSDVRTTILAGVTLSPSPGVHVRLLVVPNFHDTSEGSQLEQWQGWIGLVLTP